MKLVLQIALGVFLGLLASHYTLDNWHSHREGISKLAAEKLLAEQEKVRLEQGERIRALLLQGRQRINQAVSKLPPGFVPDDAQK
jgi:hypothetical protein